MVPVALASNAEGRNDADPRDDDSRPPVGVHAVTIIWAVRRSGGRALARALLFTRLGALAFFFSLAYFLFSYLTTFGEPAAGGGIAAALTWNVALFTIFALHHSVFAPRTRARGDCERATSAARAVVVRVGREHHVHRGLRAVAAGAGRRVARGRTAGVGLRAVQAAGVWLTLRSAVVLDIRDLAGLRAAGGGAIEFKTSGPMAGAPPDLYRRFLMVFAASPMTMTRLVFAVVSCAYLIMAIPFEERRSMLNGGQPAV